MCSIEVYTDGSCLGNQNVDTKICKAGFGVVILKNNSHFMSIYGPVIIDSKSPDYLGAEKGSNNTGELCAIGMALKYLLSNSVQSVAAVKIFYDSEYAAKSVMGIFNGKKNKELIMRVRNLYSQLKSHMTIEFVHVRAHTGDKYNELADRLAKQGYSLSQVKYDAVESNSVSTFSQVDHSEVEKNKTSRKRILVEDGSSSNFIPKKSRVET